MEGRRAVGETTAGLENREGGLLVAVCMPWGVRRKVCFKGKRNKTAAALGTESEGRVGARRAREFDLNSCRQ